jgi:hypothetical protein
MTLPHFLYLIKYAFPYKDFKIVTKIESNKRVIMILYKYLCSACNEKPIRGLSNINVSGKFLHNTNLLYFEVTKFEKGEGISQ